MNVFFVTLLVSMLLGIDAFTLRPASTSVALTIKSQRIGSYLSVVLARHENDQSTYQYILNKAREFAFSETTTSQEAKQYLQYILELESACVSGSFVGSDICDNVTELTDIVAHLRQKANQQQAIIGRYEYCLSCYVKSMSDAFDFNVFYSKKLYKFSPQLKGSIYFNSNGFCCCFVDVSFN
jgi:hypothetical protein